MASRRTSKKELLQFYELMLLIRETEIQLGNLFGDGKIPGFIHLSIGQEAIAVGIASALEPEDTLASTHRGHGHALAKGMEPLSLIHEILGNSEGACRGRGGSLHVADFKVGMLGANGIVAAGIPIALGSSLAHKILKNNRVAVVFFGDGAMAQGLLYESCNLAKLWGLSLLFVCENNGWSEFTPSDLQFVGDFRHLSESFNIDYQFVDGNDVEQVSHAARNAVTAMRKGGGPVVIECITRRVRGHYEGDPQKYRDGVPDREAPDPLDIVTQRLQKIGANRKDFDDIKVNVTRRLEAAVSAAMNGHSPDYASAQNDVYRRA